MSVELVPLTADGFKELQNELEHLKTAERPEIIKAIAVARAHGDLKENAEYHAARERLCRGRAYSCQPAPGRRRD